MRRLVPARVIAAVAALLLVLGTAALAATGATPARVSVRIALDWTPNVNYLGIYVALERGYFKAHGVDVTVLPYANTPAETLVKAGKTDLGISYPPDVIINRAQGLRYKAVAALVAHNTTALAVLASSPYRRPADLDGRLYGGFGIQSDRPLVEAILKADGVARPSFKQVVLDTGFAEALAHGRVAYTAVFAGIDDVTVALQGVKLRLFPYAKYLGTAGDYPNAVYVASDDAIASKGPALAKALSALQEGYAWAARNPAAAEQILVKWNRAALGKAQAIVAATGNATAKIFLDPAGRWGRLQDADFAGLGRILADGGIVEAVPPARDLYTNALLPR